MVFVVSFLIKVIRSKFCRFEFVGVGFVEILEEKFIVEEILQGIEKKKELEVEEINVEEFGVSQYEKQIDKFLKEKFEIVVQFFRNWFNEDWE